MSTEAKDQDLATKYLLNELSESERARSSERLFIEDDYFEQLLDAEDELFDAYIRGELTPEKQRQFEKQLLTSPEQQGKLQFAQALAQLVAEPSAEKPGSSKSGLWLLTSGFRRSSVWATGFALIAIAFAIFAGWLLFSNSRLQQQLTISDGQRIAEQQRASKLEQEIATQRERAAEQAKQLDQNRNSPSTATAQRSAIFSVSLSTGVLRDRSSSKLVEIPRNIETVNLTLELEAVERYQRFSVVLSDAAGKQVARRDALRARRVGGAQTVTVSVPANSLPAGKYELELSGTLPNGQAESVAYYYFTAATRN